MLELPTMPAFRATGRISKIGSIFILSLYKHYRSLFLLAKGRISPLTWHHPVEIGLWSYIPDISTNKINTLVGIAGINQIKVVAFNVPESTQASSLQKKSKVAKCFFYICNAQMAESLSSLQKIRVFTVDYFNLSCKKIE